MSSRIGMVMTAIVLGALGACAAPEVAVERESRIPPEPAWVRAAWVVRSDIGTSEGVRRVVGEAVSAGLETLIVQVRGRGDAWFTSEIEPRPPALQGSEFDPLAELLTRAHAAGIRVHAWVNANLVWNVGAPNPDPRHLVHAHPEWLQWPKTLVAELAALGPTDPQLLAALETYARDHRDSVEGLYADPSNPQYRAHLCRVVADLAARYPLQGIHLDYIRYAGPPWGYGASALAAFRAEVEADLGEDELREMQARVARDLLAFTRRYPRRWDAFRRGAVSALVEELAAAARGARPGLVMSAAVRARPADARDTRFQDWTTWLARGWIDVACPMIYTPDAALFSEQLQEALAVRGPGAHLGRHRRVAPRRAPRRCAASRTPGPPALMDSRSSPSAGSARRPARWRRWGCGLSPDPAYGDHSTSNRAGAWSAEIVS